MCEPTVNLASCALAQRDDSVVDAVDDGGIRDRAWARGRINVPVDEDARERRACRVGRVGSGRDELGEYSLTASTTLAADDVALDDVVGALVLPARSG